LIGAGLTLRWGRLHMRWERDPALEGAGGGRSGRRKANGQKMDRFARSEKSTKRRDFWGGARAQRGTLFGWANMGDHRKGWYSGRTRYWSRGFGP